MFITTVYKYRKDGVVYVGGEVPEGAEILETMIILNAQEGYTLIRIFTGEDVGNSIWLRNGDVQENYRQEKEVINAD